MRIVVLCGGTSTEREISIVSGTEVCKALREKGHRAILIDVFFGDDEIDIMDAFPDDYDVDAEAAAIRANDQYLESAMKNPHRDFFGSNVLKLCKMADIVFLALHGANGEDGKIQATFDLRRIRYTGTGHIGSAIAMDKHLTKAMLTRAGVPCPKAVLLKKDHHSTDFAATGLEFPAVVKVCCGGSSVGVYMVHSQNEYEQALKDAFGLEDEVLVEEYIKGREFSVGVIDGKALPVIEIAPLVGFYDYKNKYTAGSTIETCPADLSPERTARMQKLAEEGYKALHLNSYGRLDFFMKENGDMFCLEANTLPGMTPTSLLPQEAAAIGIDFPTLCENLILISLKKYE